MSQATLHNLRMPKPPRLSSGTPIAMLASLCHPPLQLNRSRPCRNHRFGSLQPAVRAFNLLCLSIAVQFQSGRRPPSPDLFAEDDNSFLSGFGDDGPSTKQQQQPAAPGMQSGMGEIPWCYVGLVITCLLWNLYTALSPMRGVVNDETGFGGVVVGQLVRPVQSTDEVSIAPLLASCRPLCSGSFS